MIVELVPAFANTVAIGPSGNPRNRVDLLVMGDGYTQADESKFYADAQNVAAQLFGISPYQEYRPFFNVVAMFTPSQQAGADHPICSDPSTSDPTPGHIVNTAFDATFCSNGIWRLVTISFTKVLGAAAAYPDWDKILVLVNECVACRRVCTRSA